MPEQHPVAQILAAEGMADYAQDLRQLSAAELRRLFAFASSGKINATRVIKNLIMANDHDDPYRDTASLFEVRRRSVVAGDSGLSAEFYMEVSSKDLDEDKDGGDEVYARVILYDPRYREPRIFHSGIISANYGGCLTGSTGPVEP